MDIDRVFRKQIRKAGRSFLGKKMNALARRIGGVELCALLNLVFTAALGFIITFPIYEVGGVYAAIPTGGFTLALLFLISLAMAVSLLSLKPLKIAVRPLLGFAIMFSLPFGLLSLPLLHSLSKKEDGS
ncbi:hypothetical protein GF415_00835 [Candidatus Micrarchaeota archaeon]|nr:hypothetical protein [Candidatus Micrarchaeota archaeon]